MSSAETEAVKGKRLSDLKVAELKEELKKRSADTAGFRLALIERLGKILKDEGHDVDTFLFFSSDSGSGAKENVSTAEDSTAENSRDSGDLLMDDSVVQVDEDGDSLMEEDAVEVEEYVEEEQPKEAEVELDEAEEVQEAADREEEVPESEEVDDDMNQGNEDSEEAEAMQGADADGGQAENEKTPKNDTEKFSSMWVRGISTSTKAADIKALFTTVGKVQTAKIFNTKSSPAACFGFVTMYNPEDVDLCIEKLHRTNFKGKVISVEKAEKNSPVIKRTGPCTPPLPSTPPTEDSQKDETAETIESPSPVSGDDVRVVESKPTPKTPKSSTATAASKKLVESSAKSNAGNSSSAKKPATTSSGRKPISPPPSKPKGPNSSAKSSNKASIVTRLSTSGHSRRSSGSRAPPYETSRYVRTREVVRPRRPIPPPPARPIYDRRRPHSRSPPHLMDRHDMISLMRRKEEEHRRREEELRLQRERERIRYEREKLEREKLEVQQMRQFQALAASGTPPVPIIGGSSAARRSGPDYHTSSSSSNRHRERRDFAESGPPAVRRRSRSPLRRDSRGGGDRDRGERRGPAHHGSSAPSGVHPDRDRYRSDHSSSRRGPGRDDPPSRSDPRESSRSGSGQMYRSADPYARPIGTSNTSSSYGHGSSSYGGSQIPPSGYSGSGGYGSSGSRPAEYGLNSYDSSRGSYGRSEVGSSGVSDYGTRRDDGGYVAPRASAWNSSSGGNFGRSRDNYGDQHSSSWGGGSMSGGQRWP